MPNVQQPEMRRSGHDPLVQDSTKEKAQKSGNGDEKDKDRTKRGPVPQEQQSPYPEG